MTLTEVHHASPAELEAGIDRVREAPVEAGVVRLIAARPAEEERELLDTARLDTAQGLVGDMWSLRPTCVDSDDGEPHPDAQVTVMNVRATTLVAGGDRRGPRAGDQLYVDLDLSLANLPPGSRIATARRCSRSAASALRLRQVRRLFGVDAVRSSTRRSAAAPLRGLNARVITGGEVRIGDPVRKLYGGCRDTTPGLPGPPPAAR